MTDSRDPDTDADSEPDTDAHPDTDTGPDTDRDPDADSGPDEDTDPDADTDPGAGTVTRPGDGATIYRVDVQITAPVMDTEVTARVEDAVRNLFPEADIERSEGEIIGRGHGMERFSEQLHEQQILDTARGAFFGGRRGDGFSFSLKKQAAFQGVVNFAVGEPGELGDIAVRVRVEEPSVEAFVDHVAPPTEEGRPVG